MAEKLTDYMQQLEAQGSPAFAAPQWRYGAKEDSLFFYFRSDESYAHRLNSFVTLFLSREGDELVGCQIKGLRRKLETDGSFCLSVKRDDRLELGLFFHLLAYETAEPKPRDYLIELGQRAKGIRVDPKDLALPCPAA